MTTNFWDDYEQEMKERAGGGIICEAMIDLVWKTFPKDIDQEKTIFSAPPCNKNSSAPVKAADKKARLAAKALGIEHGAERDPDKGFVIRAYRDNAVKRGEPVTWKGDRFFFEAGWTDAGIEVRKSIRDAGIAQVPWKGYVRIGFFDNPYHVSLGEAGMKESDQDGNPRYPQVAYIVEAFADENAAREAIGMAVDLPIGTDDAPEGWDAETWKTVWSELYKAQEAGQTLVEIAAAFDVKPGEVAKALKQYIPI